MRRRSRSSAVTIDWWRCCRMKRRMTRPLRTTYGNKLIMNHEPSEIAGAGWFQLVEQLKHARGPRVGACLTDDDLVDYATDGLSPSQRYERDAHLASCPRCCEEL